MSLVVIFGTAALVVGALGLREYQGTGINKSPLKAVFFESALMPIYLLKLPRMLDLAVKDGDLEIVRELLEAGANPNLCTHFSGPALNDAADWVSNMDMIKLLVEFGADVNQANNADSTPLHKVVTTFSDERSEEAFRYLLSLGADTYAKNCLDYTVRDWVAYHKRDALQRILDEYDAGRIMIMPAVQKGSDPS